MIPRDADYTLASTDVAHIHLYGPDGDRVDLGHNPTVQDVIDAVDKANRERRDDIEQAIQIADEIDGCRRAQSQIFHAVRRKQQDGSLDEVSDHPVYVHLEHRVEALQDRLARLI